MFHEIYNKNVQFPEIEDIFCRNGKISGKDLQGIKLSPKSAYFVFTLLQGDQKVLPTKILKFY